MPSKSPGLRELSARLAAAERWRKPGADQIRHELAVERLAAEIETVVATVPLEVDELFRLADVLTGAPSGHGDMP